LNQVGFFVLHLFLTICVGIRTCLVGWMPHHVTRRDSFMLFILDPGAFSPFPLLLLLDEIPPEHVRSLTEFNVSATNRSVEIKIAVPKTAVEAGVLCIAEKQTFNLSGH
jgi:hypothetical protein